MPRLSANLTLMFPELPFLDRLAAAAEQGFRAVEWMFSYEIPAEEIRDRLRRLELEVVLINAPAGDWEGGERGLAGLPGREKEAHESARCAIAYAQTIGCRRVHVMAGKRDESVPRNAQLDTMVANVCMAADIAAPAGVSIMIEPLNRSVDMPGYLLAGSFEGMEIIERAARPNVLLQYDVYHMQVTEGDLMRTMKHLLPQIGHIQIADNPGRNEPGTGEINYPNLLAALDSLGYEGWVGCEYRPKDDTVAGLGWAQPYLGSHRESVS